MALPGNTGISLEDRMTGNPAALAALGSMNMADLGYGAGGGAVPQVDLSAILGAGSGAFSMPSAIPSARPNAGRDVNAIDWSKVPGGGSESQRQGWVSGTWSPLASWGAMGGAGAGGGGGTAAAPGTTVNTAQANPDLDYVTGKIKERIEGPGTANTAIDLAGQKIREAGQGQRRIAEANRAARGVSGTGINAYDEQRIGGAEQRAIAGAATDIALGREKEKDTLLGSLAGVGASKANLQQQSQQIANQQWANEQANQRAIDSANTARLQSYLSMLSSPALAPTPSLAPVAAAPSAPLRGNTYDRWSQVSMGGTAAGGR